MSQHESALVLRPGSSFSLLEATIWGHLTYASEIEIEIQSGGPIGIHLNHFLGQLLVFLEHARMLLKEGGFAGELQLGLELRNVQGVSWISFPRGLPEEGPKSLFDSEVSLDLKIQAERLFDSRDQVAQDLLREVFFALNWAGATATDSLMIQLVESGYDFNRWTPVASAGAT